MEHALETNCRPKFILKRKIEPTVLKFLKQFDKVFNTSFAQRRMEKSQKLRIETLKLERTLQKSNGTATELVRDKATKN